MVKRMGAWSEIASIRGRARIETIGNLDSSRYPLKRDLVAHMDVNIC